MSTDMKLTAIVPWFGGKRTMAPEIVKELGPHKMYFEPFCGSMAVLFAKSPVQLETVNDLHGHLTNLARVLQNPDKCVELYDRLDRVLICEGTFRDAAATYSDTWLSEEPDTEAAFNYFILSWVGRNGIAGTCLNSPRGANHAMAVRWTPTGGSPTIRLRSAVQSIPAWHERLKNVVILRRDAFEIIPKVDDKSTTVIYLDPPYLRETRTGFEGSGGRSRYVHDFKSASKGDGLFSEEDDHERLAEILKRFKHARIVVSYYDCPRARSLYDGWTFAEHTRNKNLHVQNGRGSTREDAHEVLIINGPSFAGKDQ